MRQPDHCLYVALVEQRSATGPATLPAPDTPTASDLRRTFVFVVANPVIEIAITLSTQGSLKTRHVSWAPRAALAGQEAAKLLSWFVDEKME